MQKKNENGKDERKKFTCPICAQHFNSVWLLKGHSEDEHKDLLSQDIIDRYIESCKRESEETNEQKERSSPSASEVSEKEKEDQLTVCKDKLLFINHELLYQFHRLL